MLNKDPVWFSPLNIIHHAGEINRSLSSQKNSKGFRKVIEANIVAFEEEYNNMTEEQLFNSATALINLLDAVYRPILKKAREINKD